MFCWQLTGELESWGKGRNIESVTKVIRHERHISVGPKSTYNVSNGVLDGGFRGWKIFFDTFHIPFAIVSSQLLCEATDTKWRGNYNGGTRNMLRACADDGSIEHEIMSHI